MTRGAARRAASDERLSVSPGKGTVSSLRRWWDQKAWSGVVGLISAALAVTLSLTPFLERWELSTQDLRFLQRGPRSTHARIVIAAISDSTLAAWPEPMALWGSH